MRIRATTASSINSLFVLALPMFAVACVPATEEAAPGQPREDAPSVAYLKIDLVQDTATAGGAVQVVAFQRVETSGKPLAAAFEYLAVAYAGDEVLSAMPFHFPATGHREWIDADGRYTRAQTIPLPVTTLWSCCATSLA